MDWTAIGTSLANAGGWAVVVTIGVAVSVAFVRGWIGPGFAYQREVTRADAATAAVTNVTEALRELAQEVRWNVRDRIAAERRDAHRAPAS